jgi:hypothetical protein
MLSTLLAEIDEEQVHAGDLDIVVVAADILSDELSGLFQIVFHGYHRYVQHIGHFIIRFAIITAKPEYFSFSWRQMIDGFFHHGEAELEQFFVYRLFF